MTITLYANCKLTQDKNFAVDDISNYLSSFSSSDVLTETDLNYFKHKRETFILLDLGQSALNYYNKRFNFCKIQNGTDKAVYYFITNLEWRSKQVVYLTLYQDTVSTWGILPLTDKTLVHREHKDRFLRQASNRAYPIIDKVSEGLSPVMFKEKEQIVSYDGTDKTYSIYCRKWYLVYLSENEIEPTDYNQKNPISMWIIPQETIDVKFNITKNLSLTAADGEVVFSSIPLKNDLGNQYINYKVILGVAPNTTTFYIKAELDSSGNLKTTNLKLLRLGSTLQATQFYSYYNSNMEYASGSSEASVTISSTTITIEDCSASLYLYKCDSLDVYNAGSYYTVKDVSADGQVDGIGELDLTNSKIVKIIELPYCPLRIRGSGSTMEFYQNVIRAANPLNTFGIKLRDKGNLYPILEGRFNYNITVFPANYKVYSPVTFSKTALKNKDYEFKLLHSEIYNLKFSYDSFSKLVKLENITYNFENPISSTMQFTFIPSINISSKFLFDITETFKEDLEEDYSNIIVVNRNNEYPIYTSQYLNYLRTGYNYDIKAKEQKVEQSVLGGVIGLIGSIAGIAGGAASGNALVVAGGVVGAITSVASLTVNTVYSSLSAQQNIDQKIAQLKAQSNSVQSADDLSLLDYYTKNNKAKLCYYKPSNLMENNLFNLFYYLGYKCEQMKKPSLDSRLRFNFIQADIDIDFNKVETNTMNMTKEIIDDYKGRFAVGLTLFHYFNDEFDFEQQYENWESIFINDITS